MNWQDHISADPAILVGKPCIRGTRISVELVLGWLANGWTFEMIMESYPKITRDDILAALAFAAENDARRTVRGHSQSHCVMPKLLVNENFPLPALRRLRENGIGVESVEELMPGASDAQVMTYASSNE